MFADTSASQMGGGFFDSPQAPAAQQGRRRGGEPVLPITCQQLEDVLPTEAKIMAGAREFTQVTVVGEVTKITENAGDAHCDLYLTDGTSRAPIVIRHYRSDADKEDFVVGMCIRVFGRIRVFAEQASVIAFRMLVVTEPAERDCHQLEASYARLFYEKDVLGLIDKAMMGGPFSPLLNGTPFAMPQRGGASAGGGGGGGVSAAPPAALNTSGAPMPAATGNAPPTAGLHGVNLQVLNAFRALTDANGRGVTCDSVQQYLGLDAQTLRRTVDFLGGEGHLFSTIDDDHFEAAI